MTILSSFTKQLMVAIRFHSIFSIRWKSMASADFWLKTFFKLSSLRPRYASNEIEERTDMMKSGQNKDQNEVRFGSSKQLTKANILREFVLAPKHLWATIGPWWLRNRWVCSGAPPLTRNFFCPGLFVIKQRSGWGTTSQSHYINTLCRIAELPQIYPHLNDRSRRDCKDSEKEFNS